MPHPTFAPGFRLSPLDVGILLAGALTAAALASVDRWTGLAAAFVVAHFFLFCNVLRMSRPLELIWAATFAALAIAASAHLVSWPLAFAASTALTLLVATIEARRPSYHGVGWQRLNPGLPGWWQRKNVKT
jgi:hypothetical protein